jgi:hypothetical protein
MSRRRRHLHRANPNPWRREVATAGRPVETVTAAMLTVPARPGEVWSTEIAHDDGCLALKGHGLRSCSCEVVWLEARRVA